MSDFVDAEGGRWVPIDTVGEAIGLQLAGSPLCRVFCDGEAFIVQAPQPTSSISVTLDVVYEVLRRARVTD